MENKKLTLIAIGLGFLAVALGAFGAHAPVSYTHLDVYKRQVLILCFKIIG